MLVPVFLVTLIILQQNLTPETKTHVDSFSDSVIARASHSKALFATTAPPPPSPVFILRHSIAPPTPACVESTQHAFDLDRSLV